MQMSAVAVAPAPVIQTPESIKMEFHPVAELFPMMNSDDFEVLCLDIATNGLRESIWTYEGKIIDGRNRYKACLQVGEEPRFREWDGTGSLTAFIVSLNLARRHLSESQRALVAAKMANTRQGERTDLPSIEGRLSQSGAAQLLNVSVATVERAAIVLRKGVPELVKAVESGEYKVDHARRLTNLSPQSQRRVIKRGRANAKKILQNLKIKSLKKTEDGMISCFHCSPIAKWDDDHVSAFMQKLEHKAAEAFRSGRAQRNYAPFFEGVVFDIGEDELGQMSSANKEKILAAIDAGTVDGEQGMRERTDLMRITKIPTAEFDQAISVLLDYKMIEVCYQQGKTDVARGARKTLYKRSERTRTASPDQADYDQDLGDPKEDVYLSRWD